jgi:hypothetical protein
MRKNQFIPKRLVPEISNIYVQSFSMREISEVDSLVEFIEFLDEMKKWSQGTANYFSQEERFSKEITLEEIPLFMVEISLMNQDQRKLNVRFLTNMTITEFLSSLDIRIVDFGLLEVMELKGVPFHIPS